ncbi:hypothetical protein CALCODRAFT_62173 [Calocera cornea HHB12733]|uniref:Uncharacterized protein n=1 Tax=Calocera cornea HHB12733 TaxID=1353952 RepID=A0A165DMW7_9BASI|nr:hypothetical protein CALCODRAFT_62173 [Calocera cornea HHB12733]
MGRSCPCIPGRDDVVLILMPVGRSAGRGVYGPCWWQRVRVAWRYRPIHGLRLLARTLDEGRARRSGVGGVGESDTLDRRSAYHTSDLRPGRKEARPDARDMYPRPAHRHQHVTRPGACYISLLIHTSGYYRNTIHLPSHLPSTYRAARLPSLLGRARRAARESKEHRAPRRNVQTFTS